MNHDVVNATRRRKARHVNRAFSWGRALAAAADPEIGVLAGGHRARLPVQRRQVLGAGSGRGTHTRQACVSHKPITISDPASAFARRTLPPICMRSAAGLWVPVASIGGWAGGWGGVLCGLPARCVRAGGPATSPAGAGEGDGRRPPARQLVTRIIALAGALQPWRPWNGTIHWPNSDHSSRVTVTGPARPSPAAIPRLAGLNAALGDAAVGTASVRGA